MNSKMRLGVALDVLDQPKRTFVAFVLTTRYHITTSRGGSSAVAIDTRPLQRARAFVPLNVQVLRLPSGVTQPEALRTVFVPVMLPALMLSTRGAHVESLTRSSPIQKAPHLAETGTVGGVQVGGDFDPKNLISSPQPANKSAVSSARRSKRMAVLQVTLVLEDLGDR